MTAALRRGLEPIDARLTVILVHGRGQSGLNMHRFAAELQIPDIAYLAPEADGQSWYPHSFLAPLADNEPAFHSSLELLGELIDRLHVQRVQSDHIALVGFSQGACLTLEFAARHAERYAAVAGLRAGLMGPEGTPRDYQGSMHGTPVFVGCSDVDPHVSVERIHEAAQVFRELGAKVDERIFPSRGQAMDAGEMDAVRALLAPSNSAGSRHV